MMNKQDDTAQSRENKFALLLDNAAYNGAFQVGAIEALSESGLTIDGKQVAISKFDLVAGIGSGALNASFVAANKTHILSDMWFHPEHKHRVAEVQHILDLVLPSNSDLNHLYARKSSKDKNDAGLPPSVLNACKKYLRAADINPDTLLLGFVRLHDMERYILSNEQFDNDLDLIDAILSSTRTPFFIDQLGSHNGFKHRSIRGIDSKQKTKGSMINQMISKIQSKKKENEDYHLVVLDSYSARSLTEGQLDLIKSALDPAEKSYVGSNILCKSIEHCLGSHELLHASLLNDLKALNLQDLSSDGIHVHIISNGQNAGGILNRDLDLMIKRRKLGREAALALAETHLYSA